MEEEKVKAIVLNSKDYKDKDKLVELLTINNGKIFARLRSCKSPSSKLKFACQPFCFAEYVLNKQGDNFLIINATEIDSFFNLTKDASNFLYGSFLLELASSCSYGQQSCYSIFLNLISALKSICYDNQNVKMVTIKYCLNMLKILGYNFQFDKCCNCKMPFTSQINLDLDIGQFLCENCKNANSISITKNAFSNLRLISITDYDKLSSLKVKDEILKEIINVLVKNFEFRLGYKLKSSSMLI